MSLLARIRAHGGDVVQDGPRFRLVPGRLDATALAWLREPANRDRLCREVWPAYDDWEERAAIREFCGGEDRATAEAEAYREVMARC